MSSTATAREACERYREHLVDVRLHGVTADRDAHRAALRQSLGEDFVTRCETKTSQAELDCAMAATTLEQLTTCSSNR